MKILETDLCLCGHDFGQHEDFTEAGEGWYCLDCMIANVDKIECEKFRLNNLAYLESLYEKRYQTISL